MPPLPLTCPPALCGVWRWLAAAKYLGLWGKSLGNWRCTPAPQFENEFGSFPLNCASFLGLLRKKTFFEFLFKLSWILKLHVAYIATTRKLHCVPRIACVHSNSWPSCSTTAVNTRKQNRNSKLYCKQRIDQIKFSNFLLLFVFGRPPVWFGPVQSSLSFQEVIFWIWLCCNVGVGQIQSSSPIGEGQFDLARCGVRFGNMRFGNGFRNNTMRFRYFPKSHSWKDWKIC